MSAGIAGCAVAAKAQMTDASRLTDESSADFWSTFIVLHALASCARTPWEYTLSIAETFEAFTTFLYLGGAFLCLLRPNDVRSYLALALPQLVQVAYYAPAVPNHWTLTAMVNLCLVASIAQLWLCEKRRPSGTQAILQILTPLRSGVGLFYLFTGFWKLNTGWLDPNISCGTQTLQRISDFWFGGALAPVANVTPVGGLIVELGISLLLFIPSTRTIAALLFVLFHGFLGLDLVQNYQNFSSVMYAFLWLYVDPKHVQHGLVRIGALGRSWSVWWGSTFVALFVSKPIFAAGLVFGFFANTILLLMAMFPLTLRQKHSSVRLMRTWQVSWLFLLFVGLNGIAPVLGVKNRNSWQMYSNIRLEASVSNHLFLSRSLDLFGYLNQPVDLIDSNSEKLNEYRDAGLQLPFAELKRLAHNRSTLEVSYRFNGSQFTHPEDPLPSLPFWQRPLVWYRPLGPEVSARCQW